jgi:hypothetical protein
MFRTAASVVEGKEIKIILKDKTANDCVLGRIGKCEERSVI